MSENDVYDGEMPTDQLTQLDVESILTGIEPEDASLVCLKQVLIALHQPSAGISSEEKMARLAAQASALARETKPPAAQPTTERSRVGMLVLGLRERVAVVAAALVVVVGMTGVAVASDAAVPGDPLYGLDRALEVVGIGAGGISERISEAQVLTSSGQVAEAIDHVAEAIAASNEGEPDEDFSPEAANAAAALREAATSVESNDEPQSSEVRDAVATMLGEIADFAESPDFDAAEFGRMIAEMARSIGGPGDVGADRPDTPGPDGSPGPPGDTADGPPGDTPGGPPGDTPGGPSGGAGRP
jgi:hypothetical protein